METLSTQEQTVLADLRSGRPPADAIEIASRTLLQVRDVLASLSMLETRGLIVRTAPNPVHERYVAANLG